MSDSREFAEIAKGRAARWGWVGIALAVLGLALVLGSLLGSVDLPSLLEGCVWIVIGCLQAILQFRAWMCIDGDGVVGAPTRWRLSRIRLRWADVAGFECTGNGSVTRPSRVVARTVDGRLVTLVSFGIDEDAAETAVAALNEMRPQFDPAHTVERSEPST